MATLARLCFLLLLCFQTLGLSAQVFQNVLVENFDNRNGLTQNSVWGIQQDVRGLLWIATDDGLLRYDGNQFKAYRSVIGQTQKGLASNSIRYLFSDKKKYLWIGTPNGLSRLNVFTDSLRSFLPTTRIRKITPRDSNSYWLASNKGLYYFNHKSEHYFCKAPNLNVLNAVQLDDGKVLFTTTETCWLLDTKRNRYYPVLTDLPPDEGIRPIIRQGNHLWMAVENFGVWKIDVKTLRVIEKYDFRKKMPSLEIFPVRSGFLDRNGKLWLAIHLGIFCFDTANGAFEFLPSDLAYRRLNSLKGSPLNEIFEDASGILWVGSNNSGLNKVNLRLGKFQTINQDNGLNSNFILSFAERGNDLIVGTDGNGINVWNRTTNRFQVIKDTDAQRNQILSMTEVRPGLFWCATFRGLVQFDALQNKLTTPAPQDIALFKLLEQIQVRKIYKDSRQKVWLGTTLGLVTYDLITHTLENQSEESRTRDLVSSFKEDVKGNVWFGRGTGLQRYSPATGTITAISLQIPKTKIEFDDISDVNCDGDSVLWLSSYRVGIGKYSIKTGQFKLYTPADGLANSIVYGSLIDKQHRIWISTNSGLSRFDPKSETFTNFDVYDGLQNNEFNGGSLLRLKSGEMVFGGVNGFNLFRPEGFQQSTSRSPVAITDVKIMNESVNFADQPELVINHKDNFVSFEFAALDFTAPQKNQYAYQLEGVDKHWIYSGNRHFVSYSQLPAGEYTFKVKASNSDGVWNEKPATLRLVVTAPFWAKSWFGYLAIAMGVIVLILFFTNRIRYIQEREREKISLNRQIAELEMKALRAQMNPHFIFNCLNSINNFILHDENRQASKYLTKFSKLIRQILDNTDTPLAPVERIATFMGLYVELEQMRFGKNRFDFEIIVDPDIDPHETVFPTMMIQPHVENAIWHGLMHRPERGKITMMFGRESEHFVSCIVEDDGVGRAKSREMNHVLSPSRKSKGTQNVLESIETFNRQYNTEGAKIIIDDLYDEQNQPKGTRVKIVLPDLAQTELG
ncbi:two-component regulator propeller domain-containing protein [Runella sp.]|uniref:two-component regulator propeller domain-containing protein n=1 Tax=Runella sp. TaxID=1960881 RepID=UPI003D14364A